jgi:Domain of unknown function (DUF222)
MFDEGSGEWVDGPDPLPEPWNRPTSAVRPDGYAALELQSATLNPVGLSDAEVVEAVRAFERVVAWASARQARMLAEFARRRPPDRADAVDRATAGAVSVWAPDEIGLALTLSRGTAAARIDRSVRLAAVLPATLAAWDAGVLDAAKVNAIHDATLCLSDTAAQVVQERVLPAAARQTVAQLRAALERAVIAVDPEGSNTRHRKAFRARRVAVNAERAGMASLWALLSAPDALTCYGWLTALARGLPREDLRSMDARRADLLVALLTGSLRLRPDDEQTAAAADDRPAAAAADAEEPAAAAAADDPAAAAAADKPAAAADDEPADAAAADDPAAAPADEPAAGADEEPAAAAADGKAAAAAAAADTEPVVAADEEPAAAAAESGGAGIDELPVPEPGAVGAKGWGLPVPVAAAKPLVQLVMPLSTLTGADDSPVELSGYGPIPPVLAREIAADAVWKRLVTDPLSGALLDYGRTTYRPPAALADFLRARDQYCRVPICRRRALDAQMDHTVAYHAAGGATEERNLYHACLCHHRMKDAPGWSVTQHRDGRLTWVTPTGHRYCSTPFDYRPEPDLAAVVAALDRANTARRASEAAAGDEAGSGRSPFDRAALAEDPTDPPPF